MNPVISIIVPVYKVEKYLRRCIESILRQTFEEFELILVDDGSPDNCGDICDEYAVKDKRVKVIHKKNGGLSSARNAGIDIAKGEYIGFIDSDDWVDAQMYEYLYTNIKSYNAEISVCGIKVEYDDMKEVEKEKKVFNKVTPVVLNREQAMKNMVEQDLFDTGAFNKLYKTILFEGVRFPDGRIYEDLATTYKLIHKSDKVVFDDSVKYHYVLNPNSIMRSKFNSKQLDVLVASSELTKFIKENYPSLNTAALNRSITVNIGILIMMARSNYIDKYLYKQSEAIIIEKLWIYLSSKKVKGNMKLYAIAVWGGPQVFKIWINAISFYKKIKLKYF